MEGIKDATNYDVSTVKGGLMVWPMLLFKYFINREMLSKE